MSVALGLPYLRTSERTLAKRCLQAWWWSYREGLKPNAFKADARWFGTGVHLALASWYIPGLKRGRHPAETWREWCGETVTFLRSVKREATAEQTDWVDARELGVTMLEGYVKQWGSDEAWEVIQPEYRFHVLVGKPAVVRMVGTFDGVIRDHADGKIKLMEHKTAATISTGHLTLDEQAGTYWAVATHELRTQKIIGAQESLWGIEYNFLRKGTPDERPKDAQGYATNQPTKAHYIEALTTMDDWTEPELKKMKLDDLEGIAAANHIRVTGDRSKVQPAALFLRKAIRRTAAERAIQLRRIQDDLQHMNAVRDGVLPITKTPARECSFCDFADMCELHEAGGDWEAYRDFAYHVEDPYGDHRPGAQNSKFFQER